MSNPLSSSPNSSTAAGLLFGTIFYLTLTSTARLYASTGSPFTPHSNDKFAAALAPNHESVHKFLTTCSRFGLILLFAYVAENHPPFPHADKVYDRDFLFMLAMLLFLVSCFTVKANSPDEVEAEVKAVKSVDLREKSITNEGKDDDGDEHDDLNIDDLELISRQPQTKSQPPPPSPPPSQTTGVSKRLPDSTILNRDQTEEWKGWMQFMFLMYHYYHAEDIYNSIRIMITCYVWMTGFGNFSFFYMKDDFSVVRVLQMLWRLNFLVVFLCLSQGNSYVLYYICPLHTFFFFMVYFTMLIGRSMNHNKYALRIKLFLLAILIFIVWDCNNFIFSTLHFYLHKTPILGATGGEMWEWYFRTTLDHWSTFLGMIFAANFPITALWMKKVESYPSGKQWFIKGSVAVALLSAFTWWVTGPFNQDKLDYNATNCYFGFIPLITYIYLRNIHPKFRTYSLDALHTIGKTTLETYLLQHHIWLTSNAKSLLVLLPGYPKCNMIIVTVIYFGISKGVYGMTMTLRGMLMPNDLKFCVRSVVAISAAIGVCLVIATFIGEEGEVASVGVMVGVCVFLGEMVDTVIHNTVKKPSTASPSSSSSPSPSPYPILTTITSIKYKYFPQIVTIFILTLTAISSNIYMKHSSTKLQPLPRTCNKYVAQGKWLKVNTCDEPTRSIAYNEHNVVNFASCNDARVWGWNNVDDDDGYGDDGDNSGGNGNKGCRFTQRKANDVNAQLKGGRVIVYVGDSIVRNMFYAFVNGLNIDVPEEMQTVKHGDISVSGKNGAFNVVFLWAPFVEDLEKRINDDVLTKMVNVDSLIVSGGAWDCLNHPTDFANYNVKLSKVVTTIKDVKTKHNSGVTWIIPTTINERNLQTDDKRANLTETKMATYRQSQHDVLSSVYFGDSDSIVDGYAITNDEGVIKDSFDGVHYPSYVYNTINQIILQTYDWSLPARELTVEPFKMNEIGSMSNPILGIFMLFICGVGLFSFDGFLGFLTIGSVVSGGPLPHTLYDEAFSKLLINLGKAGLPVKVSGGREEEDDGHGGDGQEREYESKKLLGERGEGDDKGDIR